jgi:hypothetical protein
MMIIKSMGSYRESRFPGSSLSTHGVLLHPEQVPALEESPESM